MLAVLSAVQSHSHEWRKRCGGNGYVVYASSTVPAASNSESSAESSAGSKPPIEAMIGAPRRIPTAVST